MSKVYLCFLIVFSFSINSCMSIFNIPKEKDYSVFPEVAKDYSVEVDEITVTKDAISDKDLLTQVKALSETMFIDLAKDGKTMEKLFLSIDLKQRTYYKGISQKNSIYLVYSLFNEDNEIVYNSSYSLVSSDSIESSKVEFELLDHVNKKIRKYVNQCNSINAK